MRLLKQAFYPGLKCWNILGNTKQTHRYWLEKEVPPRWLLYWFWFCVSTRRMGWFWFSWLTSHARGLFHHLVNNTDTPKVTCERKKITSEPRTSFSRRLSSVRLLFDMASTVLNGSDRSEKWYRPFTKWKLVPTLILKAFCLAAVTYCTRSFKGPFSPSMQRAPRPNFL